METTHQPALVVSVLGGTLSPVNQIRSEAEHTMEQLKARPGLPRTLFTIVVSTSVRQEVRQAAAIFLKNMVVYDWEEPCFAEEDKAVLRDSILDALIHVKHPVRLQVAQVFRYLGYNLFPEQWPNIVPCIMANLNTNEPDRLSAALLALRLLAKKYQYSRVEEREPLEALCEHTFPTLTDLFGKFFQVDEDISYLLQKLLCKIFWSATALDLPRCMTAHANHFAQWMDAFAAVLMKQVPAQIPHDPDQEVWKLRKWIGNIMYRLFQRYGSPKAAPEHLHTFANHFLHSYAIHFLELWFRILSQWSSSGMYLPDRVLQLALNYVDVGIDFSVTFKLLKPHLPELLFNITFPLLCFSDEDMELWQDDPHEYVRKSYDCLEEYFSPRTAAINLILHTVKIRTKHSLGIFVRFASDQLANYTANPMDLTLMRRKDGALLALGSIARMLIDKAKYTHSLEPMIVTHVFPEFDNPAGFLRARACWVTGQYAGIPWKDPTNFNTAVSKILQALHDPELPVQVEAAVCLRYVFEALPSVSGFVVVLPAILESLFGLMDKINNEDLVSTLEVIIDRFGADIAPFAANLASRLRDTFFRLVDHDSDDDDDDGAMAALEVMRTLKTLLASMHRLPHVYAQLEQELLPMLSKMFSKQGEEFFEEILEIITFITFYGPGISPAMWELFPLFGEAFHDWARDYIREMLTPMDNFISRGADVFYVESNPHMNMVYSMCQSVLADPETLDMDAQVVCDIIEVVILNGPGAIDPWIQPYVSLVTNRLRIAKGYALRVLLINVVACAVFYNPSLWCQMVEAQGWLQEVLTVWFDVVDRLRRSHEMKLYVVALASLLKLPPITLPLMIVENTGLLVRTILTLLSKIDQAKEAEEKLLEGESEEDEEVEDVDDETDAGLDMQHVQFIKSQIDSLEEHEKDDGDELQVEEGLVVSPLDDEDELVFFADVLHDLHGSTDPAHMEFLKRIQDSVSHQGPEWVDLLNKLMVKAEERRRQLAEKAAAEEAEDTAAEAAPTQ